MGVGTVQWGWGVSSADGVIVGAAEILQINREYIVCNVCVCVHVSLHGILPTQYIFVFKSIK